MPYAATAIKVIIASPGDVPKERILARTVISRWNDINSEDRGIALMPIGWETHSSPEMGGRPQAIINKQILKDCDILVAVFWTRIGSPTGVAINGTVEEIEEHIAAGTPAMLYSSTAPVEPDSIDPAQYAELKKFRAHCRERGLYESYESLADFEEKLFRQLSHTIIRKFTDSPTTPEAPLPLPPAIPALTDEAKQLLLEACQSDDGIVTQVRTLDGLYIETNGRNFTENADRRTEARWEAALVALETEGYISARSVKREVFSVTDDGYKAADALRVFRQRTQEASLTERERQGTLTKTFARHRGDNDFNTLWRYAGIPGAELVEAIGNARDMADLVLIIDSRSPSIGVGEALKELLRDPKACENVNRIRTELGREELKPLQDGIGGAATIPL